ncbi:MAG: SRPBCC family protein [Chloroflexota bacterium]
MTIAAEFETEIARPVDEVFDSLAAVERWPTWLVASGIRRVVLPDRGPIGVGSQLIVDQAVAGRSTTLDARVVGFEPGRRLGLEGRDPEGIRVRIDAAVTQADIPERSRLRFSLRVDVPLRYRMFEGMVAPQARRAIALDLESFRRQLEAAPG